MKNLTTSEQTLTRIRNCLDILVAKDMAVIPNSTISRSIDGKTVITWGTGIDTYNAMSFQAFATIEEYRYYLKNNMLNALLFDGSILQITYVFKDGKLAWHRLCYYPCPFDVDYELLRSDPYLDVIDLYSNEVANFRLRTPVRFDYDPKRAKLHHSATHAHLITNDCRCPVIAPLGIYSFIAFILSNFYQARWQEMISEGIELKDDLYPHTISADEKKRVYFSIG